MTTARDAISASVRNDTPVTIEWAADLSEILRRECDEWDAHGRHHSSFWGTTRGGRRWEVRLVPALEAVAS